MASNFIVSIRLRTACHFIFIFLRSYTIYNVSLNILKTENKTANFGNGNNTDELLQKAIITSRKTQHFRGHR